MCEQGPLQENATLPHLRIIILALDPKVWDAKPKNTKASKIIEIQKASLELKSSLNFRN